MYRLMVSAETSPTVAAKYLRVHKDGNFLRAGYLLGNSCEVTPLHCLTTSEAGVVGKVSTNRSTWSGSTANSITRQPHSSHRASINALQSLATSSVRTGFRRFGAQTRR